MKKNTAIIISAICLLSVGSIFQNALAAPELVDLPNKIVIIEDQITSNNFYIVGDGNYEIEIITKPRDHNITFTDLEERADSVGDRWTIEIKPDQDVYGVTYITIRVTDANGVSTDRDIQFEVSPVNDPPEAEDGDFTTDEDEAEQGNFVAADADGDTLTYTVASAPGNGTVEITDKANGTFLYTPDDNFNGSDVFTFNVSDEEYSDSARITINVNPVNDPPEAGDAALTTNEDESGEGRFVAADADGDSLTYTVSSGPDNGTVEITDETDGVFLYTPHPYFSGSDAFTFSVSDGQYSASANITINVNRVNNPPEILVPPGVAMLNEDSSHEKNLGARDPDGDPLTYTIDSYPANGSVTINSEGSGSFLYTPDPDFNGKDFLGISVGDGELSDTAYFTMNVIPVNDPPNFSIKADELAISRNPEKIIFTDWAANITAGPENESDQTFLRFDVTTDNDGFFAVLPEMSSDGTLAFTPASDIGTSDKALVTITLTDNGGTGNGGNDTSVPRQFTIIVKEDTDINKPPDRPYPVFPSAEEVIPAENPVVFKASTFSDPENDHHVMTRWRVRQMKLAEGEDPQCSYNPGYSDFFLEHEISEGILIEHEFSGFEAGLRYAWQVGYTDSGSQRTSWSEEYTFKVSESGESREDSSVNIDSGTEAAEFEMVSFTLWPDAPSSESVFGHVIDGNNYTENFTIATYSPDNSDGDYAEYGAYNFKVEPGRAYWFLARNGLDIRVRGIPVSVKHDIDLRLGYDPSNGDGWNMIACPNGAGYEWGDVEVVVYDDDCIETDVKRVSDLGYPNNYIHKQRLWRWELGTYVYYGPEGSPKDDPHYKYDPDTRFMEAHKGYWVKVKQDNVFLRFPVKGYRNPGIKRASLTGRRNDLMEPPGQLLEDSDDSPPGPIRSFTERASGDNSSAESGSGGCFISAVTCNSSPRSQIPVWETAWSQNSGFGISW
ncbi:Ig-like domain-containing protein [Desulfococcaceae bacterium HSG8]|nr:Ig-like domain-containing protein [Desulfococcaceae bacterium HSG8]